MDFSTIHQRWLEFLNRHAVGAHLFLLPVSMVPWVIVMAIPSIHGEHNNLLNEDGGMEKEVRLTAPHLWATATVNTMGYLWLD